MLHGHYKVPPVAQVRHDGAQNTRKKRGSWEIGRLEQQEAELQHPQIWLQNVPQVCTPRTDFMVVQ